MNGKTVIRHWRAALPNVLVGTLSLALLCAQASAALAKQLHVELNRVETMDAGCQTTLVMRNELAWDIADLGVELVLFDRDGVVNQFVLLTSGPLPAGRTRVKAFMFEAVRCEDLERILVNGVTRCAGDPDAAPETCSKSLNVSSRAAVSLEF